MNSWNFPQNRIVSLLIKITCTKVIVSHENHVFRVEQALLSNFCIKSLPSKFPRLSSIDIDAFESMVGSSTANGPAI